MNQPWLDARSGGSTGPSGLKNENLRSFGGEESRVDDLVEVGALAACTLEGTRWTRADGEVVMNTTGL